MKYIGKTKNIYEKKYNLIIQESFKIIFQDFYFILNINKKL
jgi:hypothetical protein